MSPVYRFCRGFVVLVLRLFYRFRARFPYGVPHGPALLAANHTSFLDPPIVGAALKKEIHYMASDYLFKIPLFGRLVAANNSHPVRRGAADLTAFKTIEGLLRAGQMVVIFPEGTRSRTGALTPFKAGVAKLVAKTNTKAVPIYIDGAFEMWGRHRIFPKLFGHITVTFGKPLEWKDYAHLEHAEQRFMEDLRRAIEALKENLNA